MDVALAHRADDDDDDAVWTGYVATRLSVCLSVCLSLSLCVCFYVSVSVSVSVSLQRLMSFMFYLSELCILSCVFLSSWVCVCFLYVCFIYAAFLV